MSGLLPGDFGGGGSFVWLFFLCLFCLAYFFFPCLFFFFLFLAENFTLSSPRQSGQTVCNFRSPYSKSNPFAIDSALLCKFQHKGSLDFSLMKNKKINPSLEKEGSLNQTALVTQATNQHPNV